jgi:uncharacterized protein (DUF427 family)
MRLWWDTYFKIKTSFRKFITMRAIYNDQVIAESDNTVVVEGNHYFPPDSIKKEFLTESGTHTTCPWKGVSSYYNGDKAEDAAWYYPNPRTLAEDIKGYIAFWHDIKVTE